MGERGFALVITLIVTALLVALATEFMGDVYVATTARQNFVDGQQASILANSGMTGAIQLLQLELALHSDYTTLQDRWAQPLVREEERGSLRITAEEENARLSLNHLVLPKGDPTAYYEMARRLVKKLKLSPDLLEALADWVDENDEPRPGGAETSWYSTQKPPCAARNGRLDTLEELALVKGFAGEPLARLRPFVTVYADNQFSAPINVNTAPKELLAVMADGMTDDLAARIVDYRKTTPFKQKSDLNRVPGLDRVYQSLQGYYDVRGTIFRLKAEATVSGVTRTVEAVVRVAGGPPAKLYWREY